MLTVSSTFLAEGAPPQSDPMGMLVWFGAIMVIMWVLMIRPQQKRQKELAAKISALKQGDRVITIGGVHGLVISIKEGASTLVLRVDENCKVTLDKTAVATVLSKESKES
jgi:preprotein translocase subunit YajC